MLIRRSSQAPIVGPAIGTINPPWPNRLMFSGIGDGISEDAATGFKIIAGLGVVAGILFILGHSKK